MSDKRSGLRALAKCGAYLFRHKLLVVLLILMWIAMAACTALPVILTKKVFVLLAALEAGAGSESTGLGVSTRTLALICIGVGAGALLLFTAVGYAHSILTKYMSNLVAAEVREEVMDRYLHMSVAFFDRKEAGDAVVRLSGDAGSVWRLALLLCSMVEHPLKLLAAAGAIFYLNWRLGLLGFVGLPVLVYPIMRFSRRVRKYSGRGRKRLAAIARMVVQVFSGIRIVIAYGRESEEARRFAQQSRSWLDARMKTAYAKAGARAAVMLVSGMAVFPVLIAAIWMIEAGQVSVGDIVAIAAAFGFVRSPAKALAKNNNAIQDHIPKAERVFEILDMKPDMEDAPDATEIDGLNEAIAFEDVTFRYDRDVVLESISFTVPVGKTCAIVGPSGAGKSSILNLLPRLYDPTSGRVLVDGRDVRKIKMASLRSQISVVTQDPFLFSTTIAENIAYGRSGATREEVVEAARAADIHDEIIAFPDGYETTAGERGAALSGGQRQRVAIARAILRGAPILILDEATSSLDSVAEREVQAAIDGLAADRTTLVVAHRLSTISSADMIVVLRAGRIERVGRHQELLVDSPTYREMWEAQKHRAEKGEEEEVGIGSAPLESLAASIEGGYEVDDDLADEEDEGIDEL